MHLFKDIDLLLLRDAKRRRLDTEVGILSLLENTTHLGPFISANFCVITCFSTSSVSKFQIIIPMKT